MWLILALECPAISRLAPPSEVTKWYVTAAQCALKMVAYDCAVIYDPLKEKLDSLGLY